MLSSSPVLRAHAKVIANYQAELNNICQMVGATNDQMKIIRDKYLPDTYKTIYDVSAMVSSGHLTLSEMIGGHEENEGKTKEEVVPIPAKNTTGMRCSTECSGLVNEHHRFCHRCGRPINWEAVNKE
jgi:hypothetical protein